MSYCGKTLAPVLASLAIAAAAAVFLSGAFTSQAVQNPSVSFDMVTAGNSYDETTNSMTLGSIENCLTTAAPGNNLAHLHSVHIAIQNVEDLVGWQARMNYLGDRFRPNTINFIPFADNNTGQGLSFLNLPIDQASFVHRDQVSALDIPPSAPGPQTAIAGAVYQGAQDFAISPDTPAKTVPDDTSYSTTGGGVLASITLQVLAGNTGHPSLFVNMDDDSPNAPGSALQIFTSTGLITISPPVSQLGDAYHGEGATCVPLDCVNTECPLPVDPTPSATPSTPTPTPAPVAGHDARLTRIGGVPKNVRLSPGEVIADTASVVVANESNHTETIGVYVDVRAPAAGDCHPNTRVLQTTVSLAAGDKTTISIPVEYSCSQPSVADGVSYTWTAVADHGADDLCPPGTLSGLACFNALADDDEDPADNRKTRTGPKVVAQ